MTHDVGQRLLGDAKALCFNHQVKAILQSRRFEIRTKPCKCGLPVCVPPKGRFESKIIQDRWAQIQ